ncbi:MAG: hypothetical protein OXE02_14740 [Chloroflexi bacterium]|nr:hypothetical protein [Chloroflexota bacterium]
MTIRGIFHVALLGALLLLASLLLAACGGGDAGLTRAEVREIARAEMAAAPTLDESSASAEGTVDNDTAAIPASDPGLSRSEVEEIVAAAVASIPEPRPGLTADEAERIARAAVADIPPRSAPDEYTKFFVESAIALYETRGLDATLAHYNREESVDGQWYVFIIDENDTVIAHPDPDRLGLDLKGWVGTDANGYEFGPEMLSATEDGKWVSYVYQNPEGGRMSPDNLSDVDLKNAWVVRHDGLLFASGWYVDVDRFTVDVVAAVVDLFSAEGLEGTVESLSANPGSILGGVAESAVSYNSSGAVEGEWSIFIADESGTVVLHFNPAMIGKRVEDLLGADTSDIDEEGAWLTSESMRIWVVRSDGWVFGAGWRSDEPGS